MKIWQTEFCKGDIAQRKLIDKATSQSDRRTQCARLNMQRCPEKKSVTTKAQQQYSEGPLYLYKVGSSLLAANVVLLLWCLESKELFGDSKVTLQDRLLHASLSRPLHLILINHIFKFRITNTYNIK